MAFGYRDMNLLLGMVHSVAVVAGFEGAEIVTRSRHNSQFSHLALRRSGPSGCSVALLVLSSFLHNCLAKQVTQSSKWNVLLSDPVYLMCIFPPQNQAILSRVFTSQSGGFPCLEGHTSGPRNPLHCKTNARSPSAESSSLVPRQRPSHYHDSPAA